MGEDQEVSTLRFIKNFTAHFHGLPDCPEPNPVSMCLKFPTPKQLSPCFCQTENVIQGCNIKAENVLWGEKMKRNEY